MAGQTLAGRSAKITISQLREPFIIYLVREGGMSIWREVIELSRPMQGVMEKVLLKLNIPELRGAIKNKGV
jgi:hypothetical protein